MTSKETKGSKKDRILESALKLFSSQGFHSTTTKEIAVDSGVAEGLIFYYFEDKRKLLLHIVQNFSFVLSLQQHEVPTQDVPLEEALVQYGVQYLHFLKENMDYIMLIWSPEMIRDEVVSKEVLHLIGGISTSGTRMLKLGLQEAKQEETTYEIAMLMMTSSILVYFMIQTRYSNRALMLEDEPYIRSLVRLLLQGLTRHE